MISTYTYIHFLSGGSFCICSLHGPGAQLRKAGVAHDKGLGGAAYAGYRRKKFTLTLIQQFRTHTPPPNKLISLIFQYQTQRKATTVGLKMQGEPTPEDIEKKYVCILSLSLSLSLFSLSLTFSLSVHACAYSRVSEQHHQ
jgi:hypothetical protein